MFLIEAPDSAGNLMLASSGLVQILPKSSLDRRNAPHITLFAETHKRCRSLRPSQRGVPSPGVRAFEAPAFLPRDVGFAEQRPEPPRAPRGLHSRAGNDPRVPLSSSAGSPPPARKELLKAAREAALAGSPRSPRSRCSRETVASPLLLHRGAPPATTDRSGDHPFARAKPPVPCTEAFPPACFPGKCTKGSVQ